MVVSRLPLHRLVGEESLPGNCRIVACHGRATSSPKRFVKTYRVSGVTGRIQVYFGTARLLSGSVLQEIHPQSHRAYLFSSRNPAPAESSVASSACFLKLMQALVISGSTTPQRKVPVGFLNVVIASCMLHCALPTLPVSKKKKAKAHVWNDQGRECFVCVAPRVPSTMQGAQWYG